MHPVTEKKLLLTEAQVAEQLQVSRAALRKWRKEGRGPTFLKLEGRLVRYRASDIETFLYAAAPAKEDSPSVSPAPSMFAH